MKTLRLLVIAVSLASLGLAEAEAQTPPANNPLQPNVGVPYSNQSPRMRAAQQYLRQTQRQNRGNRRHRRRGYTNNMSTLRPF